MPISFIPSPSPCEGSSGLGKCRWMWIQLGWGQKLGPLLFSACPLPRVLTVVSGSLAAKGEWASIETAAADEVGRWGWWGWNPVGLGSFLGPILWYWDLEGQPPCFGSLLGAAWSLSPQPSWGQEEWLCTCHRCQESVQPTAEAGPPGEEQPCAEEDSQQGPGAGCWAPALPPASEPGPPPHQGRYDHAEGLREVDCTRPASPTSPWACAGSASLLRTTFSVRPALSGPQPESSWPGGRWVAGAL